MSVHGFVANADRSFPVDGVKIEVQGREAISGRDGFFDIKDLAQGRVVFRLSKEGFSDLIHVADLSQNKRDFHFTLNSVTSIRQIKASAEFNINIKKAEIQIPPNTFVDSKGNTLPSYDLDIMVINPNPEEMKRMPGEMTGISADGIKVPLESFGAIYISAVSGNEQLQIKNGAAITVSIATTTPDSPETLPVWSMDENLGQWKHEGVARRVTKGASKTVYTFDATHLSYWNIDQPYTATPIIIKKINLPNNSPDSAKEFFIHALGVSYNGYSSASIVKFRGQDAFCVSVKAGEKVRLMGSALIRKPDQYLIYKSEIDLDSLSVKGDCSNNLENALVIDQLTLDNFTVRNLSNDPVSLDMIRQQYGSISEVTTKNGEVFIGAFKQIGGYFEIITVDGQIRITATEIQRVRHFE